MEQRYHSCGCPIRVWEACRRPRGEPTFFDGRTPWAERPIQTCPRCGMRLSEATLRARPPQPAGTLAAYMLAWPDLRRQLEGLIDERQQHDPSFSAAAARREILALERALDRVSELAARLEEQRPTARRAGASGRRAAVGGHSVGALLGDERGAGGRAGADVMREPL